MKMRKQRCIGAVLLVVSVLLLALAASAGGTPEDCDATAVLLTAPLGTYLLITPHYILIDGAAADKSTTVIKKGARKYGKKTSH